MEKIPAASRRSEKLTGVLKGPSELREANVENLRKNYKSERTEELKEIFRMYDKVNVGYINQTVLPRNYRRHSSFPLGDPVSTSMILSCPKGSP